MWRAFCVGADEERACRFCGGVYPGSWTDDVFPADRRPFLEVCVGDRTEIFDVVDDDATSFRKRLADTFETDDSTSNIAFRISDAISADGWHRLDAFLDRVNTHMGNVVAAVAAA